MSMAWADRRREQRAPDRRSPNPGQSEVRDSDSVPWSEHKRAAIRAVREQTLDCDLDTDHRPTTL